MKILVTTIPFVLMLVTGNAGATRPFIDFRCLLNDADYVFIGSVDRISKDPIYADYMTDFYLSKIDILSSIKGQVSIRTIDSKYIQLLWRHPDPEGPQLELKRSYLFFIKNTTNGPVILNGSQGAREVSKDSVILVGRTFSIAKAREYLLSRAPISCPRQD